MSRVRALKIPARRLNDSERRNLVQSLNKRYTTPKALNATRRAADQLRQELRELEKSRRVDPEELQRPFTV